MNFHDLTDQLLANSWRAGILIAALFVVRGVLRWFIDARVIYWFWVLVAVRLLLPFDVPVSVSAARYLPPVPWTYATDFDAALSVSASAPVAPVIGISPAAPSMSEVLFNQKTLAMVWLAGVAAVLLAYLWANLSFRRQLSRSGRRAGKRTEQMVSGCSRAMGLNPIPALEMDGISGPALFGVWGPRLLFPAGLAEQLSDEELRLVVLHELGHLKRRDLFLQGLLVVSQAVHWFNPLVWLAGRLARADRELACDEFVMAHTSHSGGDAYAKTLLRVLGLSRPGRSMLPAVGILETKNQLKQRIIMITNYRSTNARRLVLGAASILAVSAALLMVNAAENPESSQLIDQTFINVPKEAVGPAEKFMEKVIASGGAFPEGSSLNYTAISRVLTVRNTQANIRLIAEIIGDSKDPVKPAAESSDVAGDNPKGRKPQTSNADAKAFDQNSYYYLSTAFLGSGMVLDVVNDGVNNKVTLAEKGNYSGQFWKLTPVDGGFYRLTTQWRGDDFSLDVVNDGKLNNQLQLAKSGDFSGQKWFLIQEKDGYFRLSTMWRGAGFSLDVVNDGGNSRSLVLAPSGNYSGQLWRLEKFGTPASKLATPTAPTSGAPNGWSKKASNPEAAIGDPKAETIIISKCDVREETVENVLAFLRAKSRELDPEKKGVQIILGGTEKTKDTRITMTLENIPLYEAVKYVAAAANLEVSWVGKAIVVKSKTAGEKPSETTTKNSKSQKTTEMTSNAEVLARVNDVAITIDQVKSVAGKKENEIRQNFTGEERERQIAETRKQALNDLINRELLLQDFRSHGYSITEEPVDYLIDETIRTEFTGNRAAFLTSLEKQGYTLEAYKEILRDQIRVQAMRQSIVKDTQDVQQQQQKLNDWFASARKKAAITMY